MDQLRSEEFWRAMSRVVSHLATLQEMNVAVRGARDAADEVKSAHYEWSKTRWIIMYFAQALKQDIQESREQTVPAGADLRTSSTSSSEPFSGNRDAEIQDTSGGANDPRPPDNKSKAVGAEECCVSSEGSECNTSAFPIATAVNESFDSRKVEETSSVDIRPETTPFFTSWDGSSADVHPESFEPSQPTLDRTPLFWPAKKKLKEHPTCRIQDGNVTPSSHNIGEGSGPDDDISAAEASIVRGFASTNNQPSWDNPIQDLLDPMVEFQISNFRFDNNPTARFQQIYSTLVLDKTLTDKLFERICLYRRKCVSLISMLSNMQRNFLVIRLLEAVCRCLPLQLDFFIELCDGSSSVKILVDLLSRLRGSDVFAPIRDYISSTTANLNRVKLSARALCTTMIHSRLDPDSMLSCSNFLGVHLDIISVHMELLRLGTFENSGDLSEYISAVQEAIFNANSSTHYRRSAQNLLGGLVNVTRMSLELDQCITETFLVDPFADVVVLR